MEKLDYMFYILIYINDMNVIDVKVYKFVKFNLVIFGEEVVLKDIFEYFENDFFVF